MLIKELSRQTGASVRSLRYYEQKKLLSSRRLPNGYRDYDDTAVTIVKTIQFYLSLGLNTDEIADISDCPAFLQNKPLCPMAYKIYKDKLKKIDGQLLLMNKIRTRLRKKIKSFHRPSGWSALAGYDKSSAGYS